MVFEPISGTIGAVALLDPALRGFSWIYGKYKLGKQFGEHYQAFSIKYRAEVARFVLIRDQKIIALESSPLNESERYLKKALRDYLLLELEAFEKCEDLMRKHEPSNLETENHREADERNDELDLREHGTLSGASSVIPDASVTSTAAGQSTPGTNTVLPGVTPITTPGSGSVRSDKISLFRKVFPRRKKAGQGRNVISPTRSAQQVQGASANLQTHGMQLGEGQIEQQERSTLTERTIWVVSDRERFEGLIKELTEYNNYFASILQLQMSPLHNEPHNYKKAMPSTQTKNIGSHLRRLIRSLAATKDSNRVLFQMRLFDDPFDLRSRIGSDLPANALLRPLSSMYAFQVLTSPLGVHTLQSSQRNNNISIMFEVPSPGQTSLDIDQQIEMERPRIESFASQFLPADSPDHDSDDIESRSWWDAIGTIKDVVRSRTQSNIADSIVVFHDCTPYVQTQTLLQCLTDPLESNIIGNTYLIYRIRLAYVLASSFMHFVSAGYPIDYFSKSLFYYADATTQSEPLEIRVLAQRRISPYIQLRSIGAFSSSKSSDLLLSSAAETASKDQVMVQSLGVLLYEVGRWRPISSAEDWRSRSSAARAKKVELVKYATVGYFNVVHACLEFTPGGAWTADTQVAWLDGNVVQPLRRLLGNLPPEFQLT